MQRLKKRIASRTDEAVNQPAPESTLERSERPAPVAIHQRYVAPERFVAREKYARHAASAELAPQRETSAERGSEL